MDKRPRVRVKYKAEVIETKSCVQIDCANVEITLNHMIVWILNNQSEALALLPDFYRLCSVCAEDLDD